MPKHCAALPGAANELLGSSTAELATALLERLGAGFPAPRDRTARHAAVLHAAPSGAPRPAAARVATARAVLSATAQSVAGLSATALSATALTPSALTPSALTRAASARAEALTRAATQAATQADRALRHRAPSRPVLAAMSVTAVTAVGAAAAITATGGFVFATPGATVRPAASTAALTLAGSSSAGSAVAATGAPATAAPAAPLAAGSLAAGSMAVAPLVGAPSVGAPIVGAPPVAHPADLPTVQVGKVVSEATATAQALATKAPPTHVASAQRPADKVATPAPAAAAAKATATPAPKAAPAPKPAPAPKATAGTGVGVAALAAARTKIGRPYSWGAVGPNAFDCSGLMVWAFKQVGVSLPRTSAAQSTVGTAVSRANLQPGDLVFFYSPVSHVGIYMGNGKILNATQSGEPVQITDMAYMPFHNARRV